MVVVVVVVVGVGVGAAAAAAASGAGAATVVRPLREPLLRAVILVPQALVPAIEVHFCQSCTHLESTASNTNLVTSLNN